MVALLMLLHRLGWPKGEISRKIEVMLNSSPVNRAMERGAVHSNRPDLPPVDYAPPEFYRVWTMKNSLPVPGNVIGKGGNAVSI